MGENTNVQEIGTQQEAPLLSICMPTLNRAGFIQETLHSILPQLDGQTELLILDGGSTDGTEAVVRDVCAGHSMVRFVRCEHLRQGTPKPHDAGFDRDCDDAIRQAHGTFCWVFPDDDLMVPGALEIVKRALGDDLDLVVVNACVKDADVQRVLQTKKLDVSSDEWFEAEALEALVARTGDLLTYVGSVVVRRSIWLDRASSRFYQTDFIHVLTLFSDPRGVRARLIADALVIIRYGNGQWQPRAFAVWMFKWPDLIWSLPVSRDAKRAVTPREPWRDLRTLIIYRAKGAFDGSGLEGIRSRSAGKWPMAAARVVLVLPAKMLRWFMLGYFFLRGKWNGFEGYDMRIARP